MTPDRHNPQPAPEELGAFADGELPPDSQARVEAWLLHNPDAAAEVESLRRVTALYRDHPPPEPPPHAWDALWRRVEARMPPARPRRPRSWPLLWAVGLAAAGLLGVLLARPWQAPRPDNPVPAVTPEDEVLQVATDQDVTVIAMDPADGDAVPVRPPLSAHDPMDFATPHDFTVVHMEPSAADGQVALLEEGPVPMIVAPRAMSDNTEP